MRKLIKSINLFAVLILIAAAIGCDNDNGGNSRALTENDFANDASLRADPVRELIVAFLEHPDSEESENDTGEVGIDEIPHTYTRTQEHTICWEDGDGEAGHFMELLDSEGNQVLRVEANGECVTELIEAGDYVMTIHHDGRNETTHPVFIIPNPDDIQAVREPDGLINRFKVAAANILKSLQNTVYKDARAQAASSIDTLINTRECFGCDLSGANLSNVDLELVELRTADLSGANLNQANLSGADLFEANLRQADLRGAQLLFAKLNFAELFGAHMSQAELLEADLSGANLGAANLSQAGLVRAVLFETNLGGANLSNAELFGANLNRAILTGAILTGADLGGANLDHANLSGADLSGANLTGANLGGANLSGADLSGADLSGALWCDGECICPTPSIGTCVGCSPIIAICS